MSRTFLVVIDPEHGDTRLFRTGVSEGQLMPVILDALDACGAPYAAVYGEPKLAGMAARVCEGLLYEGLPGDSLKARGYGTITAVREFAQERGE